MGTLVEPPIDELGSGTLGESRVLWDFGETRPIQGLVFRF